MTVLLMGILGPQGLSAACRTSVYAEVPWGHLNHYAVSWCSPCFLEACDAIARISEHHRGGVSRTPRHFMGVSLCLSIPLNGRPAVSKADPRSKGGAPCLDHLPRKNTGISNRG